MTNKDDVEAEQRLIFALLYGPVVQFARAPGQEEPSVVAMPPRLRSVDVVFLHPADATLPENISHFCFAPHQSCRSPATTFAWASPALDARRVIQALCPGQQPAGEVLEAGSPAEARPMALCVLSDRPLYSGLSRLCAPHAARAAVRTARVRRPERAAAAKGSALGAGVAVAASPAHVAIKKAMVSRRRPVRRRAHVAGGCTDASAEGDQRARRARDQGSKRPGTRHVAEQHHAGGAGLDGRQGAAVTPRRCHHGAR